MSPADGKPPEPAGWLWPGLPVRTVVLPGRSSMPYDENVWRAMLIVVLSGRLELETIGGARRTFGPGDVLFFTGLRLCALHNRGAEDVALQVVSRTMLQHDEGAP